MSFNFSDGDDSDLDLDAFDDTGLLALASRSERQPPSSSSASVAVAVATPSPATANAPRQQSNINETDNPDIEEEEEDDGGDWDNIDWEDAADDDEDGDDNSAPQDVSAASYPTQGVMINFGKSVGKSNTPDEDNAKDQNDEKKKKENDATTGDSSSKKRKRKSTVRVLKNVPYNTQQLILNVRRSQMLCNIVQSMQCSSICDTSTISIADDDGDGELLSYLAYSLIPSEFHSQGCKSTTAIPTKQHLHDFTLWYFQFVNGAAERRRNALERNVAQGAAASSTTSSSRRRGRKQSAGKTKQSAKKKKEKGGGNDDVLDMSSTAPDSNNDPESSTPINLLQTLMVLSPQYDEDPQLFIEEEENGEKLDAISAVERITSHEKVLLYLTMARSLGWRARYVTALDPMSLELTVDHPLLESASLDAKKPPAKNKKSQQLHKLFGLLHEQGSRKKAKREKSASTVTETIDLVSSGDESDGDNKLPAKSSSSSETPPAPSTTSTAPSLNVTNSNLLTWVEVLCKIDSSPDSKESMSIIKTKPVAMWASVLPEQESFDKPEDVESILAWMKTKQEGKYQHGPSDKKQKGKWGTKKSAGVTARTANTFARKVPVSYVLAVEHTPAKDSYSLDSSTSDISHLNGARLTDVTPRYANAWSRSLRLRGASGKDLTARRGKCVDEWWAASLKQMNRKCKSKRTPQGKSDMTKTPVKSVTKTKTRSGQEIDLVELESSDDEKTPAYGDKPGNDYDSDEHELMEAKQLSSSIGKEKIPTSKAAFKQSPFYVIPSVLNSQDVIHPDGRKRICGVFKGEMVYRRSDVSKALKAKKWLYQGRKVRETEMDKPAKQVKARKKRTSNQKGFQALTSYGVSEEAQEEMISSMNKKKGGGEEDKKMDDLYGVWQTDDWAPEYIGPNDSIPTNEFRNVELALMNPGLTHIHQTGLAQIAKKLGIPYAPCMLGYDRRGNPTISGIVVHDHNVALMREASVEYESHAVEKEREKKRNEIMKKWKRLVVGIMTKERLEREYG